MKDSTSSSGRTDPRDAKPRLTGGSPSGFTLDTSGFVSIPVAVRWGPSFASRIRWSDLSPFTQGYIEALFASILADEDFAEDYRDADGVFAIFGDRSPYLSDLAPETLARIIADCEGFSAMWHPGFSSTAGQGREFWTTRQRGSWGRYRPLAPYLGDDGRVCLREAE